MLSQLSLDPWTLRVLQAAVSLGLVLAVLGVAYRAHVPVFREGLQASLRGLLQITLVGSVLLMVLQRTLWLSLPVFVVMVGFASSLAQKRASGLQGAQKTLAMSIALGSLSVIALMTGLGVMEARLTAVIPIGSMLIANSMTTVGLVMERLQADVTHQRGQIEAALSLGATPEVAIQPHLRDAVRASLIPRMDSMRSLGIVWIPGMMTGMLLAGVHPMQAALYQFVIVAMILASGTLSALTCGLLARQHFFTPSAQLHLNKTPS
ncbi:MAG: ABC transporter permease [Deltaproteobacteria bacterium]|nr:MAG: ABC transporter permease [Deltaproteobacteria bacterium]